MVFAGAGFSANEESSRFCPCVSALCTHGPKSRIDASLRSLPHRLGFSSAARVASEDEPGEKEPPPFPTFETTYLHPKRTRSLQVKSVKGPGPRLSPNRSQLAPGPHVQSYMLYGGWSDKLLAGSSLPPSCVVPSRQWHMHKPYIVRMDGILHQFETMGSQCSLIFTKESNPSRASERCCVGWISISTVRIAFKNPWLTLGFSGLGAYHPCGSKNRYQNETLVSGSMDQNLRNPRSLILSHTRLCLPIYSRLSVCVHAPVNEDQLSDSREHLLTRRNPLRPWSGMQETGLKRVSTLYIFRVVPL